MIEMLIIKCINLFSWLKERAIYTFKEISAFMTSNPLEIITLILEDYVKTPKGLTKKFEESGLRKYWFPASNMPKNGNDWPLVSHMIAKNQRLVVFTSDRTKEASEGIAYQWNYMVENQCEDMNDIHHLFLLSLILLFLSLI